MPEIIHGVEVADIQLTESHYTMPQEVVDEVSRKVNELTALCDRLRLPALCMVQTLNHPDKYDAVNMLSHPDGGRSAYAMTILMGAFVVLTDNDYTIDDRLDLLKAIADIRRKHEGDKDGTSDVGTH